MDSVKFLNAGNGSLGTVNFGCCYKTEIFFEGTGQSATQPISKITNTDFEGSGGNEIEIRGFAGSSLPNLDGGNTFGGLTGPTFFAVNVDDYVTGQTKVDAEHNNWKSPKGPSGKAFGDGTAVGDGVDFNNWIGVTGDTLDFDVYRNSVAPTNLLANAWVAICVQGTTRCQGNLSDSNGHVTFTGLQDAQSYDVTGNPPAGSALFPDHETVPVACPVAPCDNKKNLVLTGPQPPAPGTTLTGPAVRRTNLQGLPIVYWTQAFKISTTACAGGSVTYQLFVNGEATAARSGSMTESPAGSGLFSVDVQALAPLHGDAKVVFAVTGCPAPPPAFNLYIDPSGTIVTPDRKPIAAATVTLFRLDEASGTYQQVDNGSAIMDPTNQHNPDLSDAWGNFGWNVVPGSYKVRAAKAGCTATASTEVLVVPPAAVGLLLTLDCPTTLVGNVTGSGTVTAVDALCVLRNVAKLNSTTACSQTPSGLSDALWDVNQDGAINAVDALCILRSVAGLNGTTNCPMIPTSPPVPVSAAPGENRRQAVLRPDGA
ncbi:MAG: dockerin type I domain-containing protein [Dehalococcoidia bacterium]